jgi:hypothetical protein
MPVFTSICQSVCVFVQLPHLSACLLARLSSCCLIVCLSICLLGWLPSYLRLACLFVCMLLKTFIPSRTYVTLCWVSGT